MLVTNLTLQLAYGGDKPYTETFPSWLRTLQWDLLRLVTNLTLIITHAGDKSYRFQNLHREQKIIHDGDIPYIETY